MHTIVVSVNYRTAPVEVREKLAFIETQLADAMTSLREQQSIYEAVILSTCNRTELYTVADSAQEGRQAIIDFISQWFTLPAVQFEPHLLVFEDDEAIEHLLKLTVGMDSMVLGETQILGQVRDSFLQAQALGTTGTVFNQLFRQAVTFSKRMHSETSIGSNAVSISYAAVELGKQIFGTLHHKHVAILGAGEMGELALQNLQGSGISDLTVINRTIATAEEMAARFGGTARPITALQEVLATADILISSTAATEPVISRQDIEAIQVERKGRPLFLIDIAVPRDIDPAIAELSDVFLYDIDDLQGIVDANLAEREKAAEAIHAQVEGQIIAFNEWLVTLGVVPMIKGLREKAFAIQESTMESLLNKIPDLDEREIKVIMKHTSSIVNQILRDPIHQIKELASEKKSMSKLALLEEVFGIEEHVQTEQKKEVLSSLAQARLTKRTTKTVFTNPSMDTQ